MPVRVLASGTDPFFDHALKLSHPMPFHVVHTDGERISKKKKGFALVGLVFEIVYVHSFYCVSVGSSWAFSEASTTSSIILFQESSAWAIAANASFVSCVMVMVRL